MTEFASINADNIDPTALKLSRARALVSALESAELPYVGLISAQRLKSGAEALIVDVEVELGQEPPVAIQRCERVAVVFTESDDSYPEVYALRTDFPHVPHLNCREDDVPKSLCLYEDAWAEVRLRWTPSGFVERIRTWLALTAEGKLHGDDQPLEPILLGRFWRLVLPSDLFSAGPSEAPERLLVGKTTDDNKFNVLIAQRPNAGQRARMDFVATTFQTDPQQHGVIRRQPKSLADLAAMMKDSGADLLGELRKRLRAWEMTPEFRKANLIIVAYFPKTRSAGGAVETRDVWSFVTESSLEDLGKKLGLWDVLNGHVAPFLSPDLSGDGGDIRIDVLNISFGLSRAQAAALNGVSLSTIALTAVGAGALGSQVIPKLLQSGFGKWTVIDDDHLLPHNVARHQFSSGYVGLPKADLVATFCDSILEGDGNAKSIVANVLSPGEKEPDVHRSLETADVIVDFSASVAVGRFLARFPGASARRISVFLNPTGTDLVVLAEDSARTVPLDYLEMIYYSEVASNSALERHLSRGEQRLRYARSCRDLTSTVPEDLVGLHSGIASRAIRDALSNDGPVIKIWKTNPELSVDCVSVPVPPRIEIAANTWRLVVTEQLIQKVHTLREAKLPNETGGVFIGHFDTAASVAYIVDTLPAPPDSKEYPVHYIRGSAGLRTLVKGMEDRTATMLHYVGEWHSHPNGYSCAPSGDDQKVFAWLTRWMQIDGYPGLMLIAGEQTEAWFIGRME